MKTQNFLLVPTLLFSVVFSLVVRGQRSRPATEFSAEDSIAGKSVIPVSVMKAIRLQEKNLAENAEFEGAVINLNDDGRPDFLVQGDRGASITGFWLFLNENGKYRMVLADRAHDLTITVEKTKKVRNINTSGASAVTLWETIYHFNGQKYLAAVCTELDMTIEKSPKKVVPCRDNSEN